MGQNAANNTKIAVPTFAFGPMNYRAALPVDSSAVVILTNPPLQTEAPLIQTIVQELNNRNRAVTVFYVPTNGRDASAATIAMVQGAFLDSTEAVPSLNKVYTFYPYDPAFGGQYGPTGNEALDFANYYRDLLDPNHSMYLPPKIRDVFAMGIMRLELRL